MHIQTYTYVCVPVTYECNVLFSHHNEQIKEAWHLLEQMILEIYNYFYFKIQLWPNKTAMDKTIQ